MGEVFDTSSSVRIKIFVNFDAKKDQNAFYASSSDNFAGFSALIGLPSKIQLPKVFFYSSQA